MAMWYYAWKFNRPDALCFEQEFLKNGDNKNDRSAIIALICAHRLGNNIGAEVPSGNFYQSNGEVPIVIARSGWTKDDAYLGLKGGCPQSGHAHLDEGTFCYEAYGEKWTDDYHAKAYQIYRNILKKLGNTLHSDSQDYPGWDLFHVNNRQHSTLTINNHTVSVHGNAVMEKTYDTPEMRGGTLDMTTLYTEDLSLCKRTAVLLPDDSLKITDEVATKDSAEVRWTCITKADIKVLDDCIELTRHGVTVKLKTDAPGAKFQRWSEDPAAYNSRTAKYERGQVPGGYHICGYTFSLPAGQHCEFVTTISR